MRYGLPLSVLFHALLLAVVLIGLPSFSKPIAERTVEVPIEVVRIDEVTNPPPGKKEDARSEKEPDDESASKNRAAEGGRTRPLTRPETPPSPSEVEVKKAPDTPDKTPSTPKNERETPAPKEPALAPEPPKHDVKKAPDTPNTETPKAERETPPERPVPAPAQPKVSVKVPKSVEKSINNPDATKKTDIKKPPAPPEPERTETALRPPPRVTTPEPSKAPDSPDADRDASAAKKPTPPPKPTDRQFASLRPPAENKSMPAEPREEEPKVKSQPTYRPDRGEPEKKEEDKPSVTSRPTYRAPDKAPPDTKDTKAKQPSKKPDPLDSVFKSVDGERAKRQAETERSAKPERTGAPQHRPNVTLGRNEIDALKERIRRCWSVDPAAKDLESLVVVIEVWMNRDATVNKAEISDETKGLRNPIVRAFAERAVRAVRNPACQPFPLSESKYDAWKYFKLEFDPSDQ